MRLCSTCLPERWNACAPVCAASAGMFRAFHLSGKQVLESRMTFRREGVPMGLPGFSEFEVWQTSEQNIRAARQALDTL